MVRIPIKDALNVFGKWTLIFEVSRCEHFPDIGEEVELLDIAKNSIGSVRIANVLPSTTPKLHSLAVDHLSKDLTINFKEVSFIELQINDEISEKAFPKR